MLQMLLHQLRGPRTAALPDRLDDAGVLVICPLPSMG
jgi:hypothetical protein